MKVIDKLILFTIIIFVILYVKFFYKIVDKHLKSGKFLDNHPTYGNPFYIHFSIVIFAILMIITIINKIFR